MPTTSPFEKLLAAAAAQSDRQALLFVFAGDQPDRAGDATHAEHRSIVPLMCVEKPLDELTSFEALVHESREVGPPWQVVFAAGVCSRSGTTPAPADVTYALQAMVDRVHCGAVAGLLAFSPSGESWSPGPSARTC